MVSLLTNSLVEKKEEIITKIGLEETTIILVNFEKVKTIIKRYNGEKRWLISILLDIQAEYNYLPRDALIMVANNLDMLLTDVYSVATFYKVFSLKPRGKHLVSVCLGTACHVRGGGKIADKIKQELKIDIGETTEDGQFTLETVRCLGCCATGPIVVIDNDYNSQVSLKKISKILKKYRRGDNS